MGGAEGRAMGVADQKMRGNAVSKSVDYQNNPRLI